jgi:predicted CopG family antitoxin
MKIVAMSKDVYRALKLFGIENRIEDHSEIILKIFSELEKINVDYYKLIEQSDVNFVKNNKTSILLKDDDVYWKLMQYRYRTVSNNFSHVILNLLKHLGR